MNRDLSHLPRQSLRIGKSFPTLPKNQPLSRIKTPQSCLKICKFSLYVESKINPLIVEWWWLMYHFYKKSSKTNKHKPRDQISWPLCPVISTKVYFFVIGIHNLDTDSQVYLFSIQKYNSFNNSDSRTSRNNQTDGYMDYLNNMISKINVDDIKDTFYDYGDKVKTYARSMLEKFDEVYLFLSSMGIECYN